MVWERMVCWSGEGGASLGLGYERRRISRNGAPSRDGNGIWREGGRIRKVDRMPGSGMKKRSRRAIWMSARRRLWGEALCESGVE